MIKSITKQKKTLIIKVHLNIFPEQLEFHISEHIFQKGSNVDKGYLVNDIIPDSGASRVLKQYDIIKAINGEFIENWESFYTIMFKYFPSQYVQAWILRDGKKNDGRIFSVPV